MFTLKTSWFWPVTLKNILFQNLQSFSKFNLISSLTLKGLIILLLKIPNTNHYSTSSHLSHKSSWLTISIKDLTICSTTRSIQCSSKLKITIEELVFCTSFPSLHIFLYCVYLQVLKFWSFQNLYTIVLIFCIFTFYFHLQCQYLQIFSCIFYFFLLLIILFNFA